MLPPRGKKAAELNPTESVTVTDLGSKTLTYEYDPVNGGRLIAQVDGLGAKTTYGVRHLRVPAHDGGPERG